MALVIDASTGATEQDAAIGGEADRAGRGVVILANKWDLVKDRGADFVTVLRKAVPSAPLTLVGHSSGGGFGLRVAGSPIQNLFERTVLLAPYLGYDAPSTRRDSGGWPRGRACTIRTPGWAA